MPTTMTGRRWAVQEDGSYIRTVTAPEPDDSPKPRTHAEIDEIAKERGIVFPDGVTTVKDRIAYLEDQS